jgi:glycerol-3-phosphate cytidylyltransferase-like family protein
MAEIKLKKLVIGQPMPHRAIVLGLNPDEWHKFKKGEVVTVDDKHLESMQKLDYVEIVFEKKSSTTKVNFKNEV